jgi:hypothetical protein
MWGRGYVVVQELAEEGEPSGQRGVVRVVRALRRVRDQCDRVGQVVLSIHRAPGSPQLAECVADQRHVGRKWRERREQPAEPAPVVEGRPGGQLASVCIAVSHVGPPHLGPAVNPKPRGPGRASRRGSRKRAVQFLSVEAGTNPLPRPVSSSTFSPLPFCCPESGIACVIHQGSAQFPLLAVPDQRATTPVIALIVL